MVRLASARKTLLLLVCLGLSSTLAAEPWFEDFKRDATPVDLYRFLYAMPKGGDLHSHLTGSVLSEWYYEHALAAGDRGYRYLVKVRIDNCQRETIEPVTRTPYLLLGVTLQESTWQRLPACHQGEFKPLDALTEQEKADWLDGMRLDRAGEGRNEFFSKHWERMADLGSNPWLIADVLVRNMAAFGAEGLVYWEPGVNPYGMQTADGTPIPADEVADLFRARLAERDARATGVTVRMELATLRFLPNAEDSVREDFDFVSRHRDLWVGVDLVGREDDDKGHPARFIPVMRELRRTYHGINLSVHGGEVDEPNSHVRDTLLLGATRIGHGINLISDPATLLLMRQGPWLVEINLVSNLLLEYVSDYSEHPFPEYLRIGVPVALSTDDRGMWDSNLTDEFFVAVTEFNLSLEELRTLHRNSISFSYLEEPAKARLLAGWEQRMATFERAFQRNPERVLAGANAVSYGFLCERYAVCLDPR